MTVFYKYLKPRKISIGKTVIQLPMVMIDSINYPWIIFSSIVVAAIVIR
ncbi:MAG: hypothetical protein AB7F53_03860 [Nitrososphaeraceae archaeon]